MKSKKIPSSVHSALGPVPVEFVPNLKDQKGVDCLGTWNYNDRKLRLRPEQPAVVAWQTFFHEKVHMWLNDAGVTGFLSEKQEEAVCDALSTAMLAEMLNTR